MRACWAAQFRGGKNGLGSHFNTEDMGWTDADGGADAFRNQVKLTLVPNFAPGGRTGCASQTRLTLMNSYKLPDTCRSLPTAWRHNNRFTMSVKN
jgi:hypothetical protein